MSQGTVNKLPYRDPARPVEARVSDLLSRMTLEEKSAQLGSRWVYELLKEMRFSEPKARQLLGQGIGHITRIGGASSLGPKESAELANAIQSYRIKSFKDILVIAVFGQSSVFRNKVLDLFESRNDSLRSRRMLNLSRRLCKFA